MGARVFQLLGSALYFSLWSSTHIARPSGSGVNESWRVMQPSDLPDLTRRFGYYQHLRPVLTDEFFLQFITQDLS